jgi:hypothetical protein
LPGGRAFPHLTDRETEAQRQSSLFTAIELVSGNSKHSFSRHEKKEEGGYGVVVHACNPRAQKLRQENCEFQASLGYKARPCLKTKLKT